MLVAVVMAMIVVMGMIVRMPVVRAAGCVVVPRLAMPAAAAGAVLPRGQGFVDFDWREGHLLRLL
ncbi:hypothetical protein D3C71_2039790 [compost metagenome]